MSTATPVVQAPCPKCGQTLRLPADWIDRTLRCKHCRQTVVALRKPKAAAPPLPSLPTAAPPLPVAAAVPPPLPVMPPLPAAPAGYPPVPPAVPPGLPPAAGTLDFHSSDNLRLPPGYRRRGKLASLLQLVAVFGVLGGGAAAAWFFVVAPELAKRRQTAGGGADDAKPAVKAAGKSDLPPPGGTFPRRLLVVSVNNYLYANPLNSGAEPADAVSKLGHGVKQFAETFAGHLQVPKDQTYLLTDGVPGADARPPLKPAIEQAVTKFLDTSRKQDRVVLVFTGHAVEIDKEPYLVPLEGELAVKETLIPLKWVYDKMAACPAQQKVFVIDVCRFDPGRGNERPDGGPMGEELDKMLANPPAGVQVWSSCTKGQNSYEYDYQGRQARGVDIQIKGSTFLNLFFYGTLLGNKAGIQRPDDPIKLAAYAEPVNKFTVAAVKDIQKAEQTPRLSGSEPGAQVAYDAAEPAPPKIEMPRPADVMPKGVADKAAVKAVLAELSVPPIKYARGGEADVPLDEVVPFAADAMAKYAADAMPAAEVLKAEAKYPVRAHAVRAAELLRKLRGNEEAKQLPEDLRGSATDGVKKDLAELQKRVLAKMQFEVKELIEEMEQADRDAEKSPRWQATFDYMFAQLKARYAYTYEYNFMFAKIRKDELPELNKEAGHNGWRLASRAEPQSPGEAKEIARDSMKLFDQIAKKHAGTPWAVLAKRDRMTAIGLKWEPTRFE